MMTTVCRCVLVFALTTVMLDGTSRADWRNWRGPLGAGVAPEERLPERIEQGQAHWQIDLPGPGSSTPVVSGDSVFLTCVVDEQDTVCCYGLDGGSRWSKAIGRSVAAKHRAATGANPSPVNDGQHVVAYFKSGNLACFTVAGEEVWNANIQELYGENTLWWDLGSSPVMTSTGVVIAVLQDNDAFLVCLDLATGEEIWKADRTYERPEESGQAYTTPAVVNVDGVEQLVTFGADMLTGHDAATGRLMWVCGGFNPTDATYWRTIASPTVSDGVAVTPYGRGDFLAGVRIGGEGDVTDSNVLWRREQLGADVPTAAAHAGAVYLLGDRGQVTCLDLRTGEDRWTASLPRSRVKYYASPLVVAGRLCALRLDGTLFVVELNEGLNIVSQVELGEMAVASPVQVDGKLLVRTKTKLFCFGD